MRSTSPDTPWPLPAESAATVCSRPTALEDEVVRLFEQFRSPLLRYVMSIGLIAHDGEEIVQDVFLALFQHLRDGKPRTNLKAWVYRVAHNLALKRRARNGQRERLQCSGEVAESLQRPQLNPEEELLEGRRRRKLRAEVAAMPEVDRCCLYLRAEGLRYRDIANVLGISLGGVSLALTRALTRLCKVDE